MTTSELRPALGGIAGSAVRTGTGSGAGARSIFAAASWWPSTLSRRLSLVVTLLLLLCCGASTWVQMRASVRHEQEVIQRLSLGLASHIAGSADLMASDGLKPGAVHDLFDKLMAVNPSVEVYLLGTDGRIEAQAAPDGQIRRERVDLAPVRRLLAGAALPVLGDDPRSDSGEQKIFSAAPLMVNGRNAGYVYVVLFGQEHDALAARLAVDNLLRTSVWLMALVAFFGVLAALAALAFVTRPLRQLTAAVRSFETQGVEGLDNALAALPAPGRLRGGDDIAVLGQAFEQMAGHIGAQWRELTALDRQRRELFANLSHDLRTPLTSLHGYLETLLVKSASLSESDRRRYLEVALGQSRKVGRLAQELFELARLEYGVVKPEKESFVLADLVQDVMQKCELAAEARQQRLEAVVAPGLPTTVQADIGMIDRVLTNLLDNAIRHTPSGGAITVRMARAPAGGEGAVEVEVRDTGPGIPPELVEGLFHRPAFPASSPRDGSHGGLGLMIVRRMLLLHDSDIVLDAGDKQGAVFRFRLAGASA